MFLVYVQTMIGPQPQKVPELVPDTRTGNGRYLATHELPRHQVDWSIDALRVMYPLAAQQEQGQ